MAEVTPNLGLTKPELNDNITPTIFAENFELIDEAIHTLKTTVNDSVQKELTSMKSTFQAGVDTCYNGCVNRGATPSAKTPAAISDAIGTIYNNRYSQGHNQGYSQGYNQGVTDADNRANGNSVNYQTGYNNGYNAGVNYANSGRSVRVLMRPSELGHDPKDTDYKDINVIVYKDGNQIFTTGWYCAGAGTGDRTFTC